jgi:AcrR family transcriptional regulator
MTVTSKQAGGRRRDRRTRSARAEGTDARAALLAAAAEVFAERGFANASVDEVTERAGYSKGALYWHFQSKHELFFALIEQTVDAPAHEMIELLHSAPVEQDMAPEASRRMIELVARQRDLVLLDEEYWAQAVRDPALRARYKEHRERLREAIARALEARLEHLGTPIPGLAHEHMATLLMGLTAGLLRERMIDPQAVPDEMIGRAVVLIYRGALASVQSGGDTSLG